MRLTTMLACLVALVLVTGCKKKKYGVDYIPLAELQPRAAKFEPVLVAVKKIPVAQPPVTKTSIPSGAFIGEERQGGTEPTADEYLVIHTEDLATPGYWSDEKVKVRIGGSGLLSGCTKGLEEVKAAKEPFMHKYTLLGCTKFKFAYVVRTTEYLQPKTRTASDTTSGNKRTIVENVVPGHVNGDVNIYSLPDGKLVGGFQFRGESSDKPSTEGGFLGAVDRDLVKQANIAIRDAAAGRGGTTPAATATTKPGTKAR